MGNAPLITDDSGEILDLIWGEDSSLEDVNNGMQKMLGNNSNAIIYVTLFRTSQNPRIGMLACDKRPILRHAALLSQRNRLTLLKFRRIYYLCT